ncbi:mavicyanin-like [Cynara cardunculus var. scolymus]|uniref:Cupredoxin n=1 Tax=Cynara cardunculus var. scolymus TaxID=59895 RepID=A0A124SD05_CYNCS|nr:mavicyanin-like [Cynara cardunculus var. scolymus]KVH95440.1 Cupredoxin [Cynara cardunculus var. scolymus]
MSRVYVIFIATLVAFAASVSATEYIVGDESGWTLDFDYQTWAQGKRFFVGDKLVFNYPLGKHNVLRVNGTSFQQCMISSSNDALTNGNDVVTLLSPGRKWYICGVGKHCELRNMKLVINVESMSPAPSPSTTSGSSNLVIPKTYGFVVALIGSLLIFLV